jgi:tetratricopeptide (TPR) repeat protein
MELSGIDRGKLSALVIGAVTDEDDLARLLADEMDIRLEAIVKPGNLQNVVFELLRWLDVNSRTLEFIDILVKRRPHLTESLVKFREIAAAPRLRSVVPASPESPVDEQIEPELGPSGSRKGASQLHLESPFWFFPLIGVAGALLPPTLFFAIKLVLGSPAFSGGEYIFLVLVAIVNGGFAGFIHSGMRFPTPITIAKVTLITFGSTFIAWFVGVLLFVGGFFLAAMINVDPEQVRGAAAYYVEAYLMLFLCAGGIWLSLQIASLWLRSDNTEWQRDLAVSYNNVGSMRVAQDELNWGLNAYRDGLVILERLAKVNPGNAGWQYDLGISHERIGDVLMQQGKLAAALKEYEAKKAIIERLAEADPGNTGWQRDLSVSYNKVGNVLVAESKLDLLLTQGKLNEALKAYRDCLAIFERLTAADSSNTQWQHDLAVAHAKLALVYERQGRIADASQELTQGREIMAPLVAVAPGNAQWKKELVWFKQQIASLQGQTRAR